MVHILQSEMKNMEQLQDKPKSKFGQFMLETVTNPEAYASRVLPLAAIAESVASRGQGRNMAQEQQQSIYAQAARDRANEQNVYNRGVDEEARKQTAYETARKNKLTELEDAAAKEMGLIPQDSEDWTTQAGAIERKILPYKAYEREKQKVASGGLGAAALTQKQAMLDKKIASMPEGEEKKWYQDNYYMLIASPSAVFPISEQGMEGATERAIRIAQGKQPVDVSTAVQKTEAVGKAEAKTPAFISSEQQKWSAITTPYKEIVKNYGFGNSGATGAIGQVALVKALEKVREPSSAVMFGDAEIYRKAGGFWDKVVEGGFIDASSAALKKTLPPEYEKELRVLLDEAMKQSTANIVRDRENRIDVAVNDYGWPQERAERIYRTPLVPEKKVVPGSGNSNPKIERAKQALNDPEATEQEKAAARKILQQAGQ
jgi:hypothetical protein